MLRALPPDSPEILDAATLLENTYSLPLARSLTTSGSAPRTMLRTSARLSSGVVSCQNSVNSGLAGGAWCQVTTYSLPPRRTTQRQV